MFDLASIYSDGFRLPEKLEIDDWARRNIHIGSWSPWEGPFYPEKTPWIIEPLRTLAARGPKAVMIAGPAAGGKSTIGEVFAAWAVNNAPGPLVWYAQDEDAAKEFAETRVQRFLESCELVRRWFPADRHQRRTQSILFPHMSLLIQAANIGNAQSKHIRHLIMDEPHLYKSGIFTALLSRTTRFSHNRTILGISTGSTEGDEFDLAWRSGTRQEWQFRCPECGENHVPHFDRQDGAQFGGVTWDQDAKKLDGTWDYKRVARSVRYECHKCGRAFEPSPANGYRLNEGGCYTLPATDAQPEWSSFHWNAVASDFSQLAGVVTMFLKAVAASKSGDLAPLKDFVQKKKAEAWREDIQNQTRTELIVGASEPPLEDAAKFMAVDCQEVEPYFWFGVREFDRAGNSRRVDFGSCNSFEELRATQLKHGIPDHFVGIDSGYRATDVYRECLRWGRPIPRGAGMMPAWRGWVPMKGMARGLRASWKDANGNPQLYHLSPAPTSSTGILLYLLEFSGDTMKDILSKLRNPKGDGSVRWEIPEHQLNEVYWRHLDSEIVRQKPDGFRWEKRSARWPNHLLDVELELLVLATLHKRFNFQGVNPTLKK